MIKNISALENRLKKLEEQVQRLEVDRDNLTALGLDLEERITKVENGAFDRLIDRPVDDILDEEFPIGGTDGDDD